MEEAVNSQHSARHRSPTNCVRSLQPMQPKKSVPVKPKDTVKRKAKGRGQRPNAVADDFPRLLKKEMQNIQAGLNKMESKFVKKIAVLEKKQQMRKSGSKRRKQAKKCKRKNKSAQQKIMDQRATQELFLVNPNRLGTEKPALASRIMPLTPFPGNQAYLQESVTKAVMEQMEAVLERRVREQAESTRQECELRLQKTSKRLEK